MCHRSTEVSDIIREFQARIIEEASNGYDGSDIPKYKWTFSGSLLYSITVITTIGKEENIRFMIVIVNLFKFKIGDVVC